MKREISVDGTSVVSIRAAQFTARPPVTRIVVTLKRKLNYVVNRSAGQLTVDLNTNMAARGHLVAIDPGHGGQDPGAIGPSGLVKLERQAPTARKLDGHATGSSA